jgi:hypothetical protein
MMYSMLSKHLSGAEKSGREEVTLLCFVHEPSWH